MASYSGSRSSPRTGKTWRNRPSVKSGFEKGSEFESYIISLFPEQFYSLEHATTRRDDLGGRMVRSALNPDFQLKHIPSGDKFWVECKYRSDVNKDINWCKDERQLKRYKEFQEKVRPEKVFIVIGLGGSPKTPKKMFCLPLDEIDETTLYLASIDSLSRYPKSHFFYTNSVLK